MVVVGEEKNTECQFQRQSRAILMDSMAVPIHTSIISIHLFFARPCEFYCVFFFAMTIIKSIIKGTTIGKSEWPRENQQPIRPIIAA